MGKKFLATMIVAVVAVVAGYNVYQSQSKVVLSELALANVEALAQTETTGSCEERCYSCDGWRCTRIYNGVTSVCDQHRKKS